MVPFPKELIETFTFLHAVPVPAQVLEPSYK